MILAPLVIDLGVILMFLVAFALCLLAQQIVRALFQIGQSAVGWIPWLGSRISGDLHRIEQRMTHALGAVAFALQYGVGAMFHGLASLMQQLVDSIEGNAALIWQIAHYLPGLATVAQLVDVARGLAHANHATVAGTRAVTRVIHDVTRVVTHTTTRVNTTVARVQAIPADVLLPGALSGVRGRVRAIEDELASLRKRVGISGRTALEGVGVGALAYALGRLGMSWARCSNVGRLGRRACGMDANLLESLLADTLLVVGTLSLVEFAEEMQGVAETAVRPITSFWRAS